MNPQIQDILNRLAALESKSLQVQLQPTERENLKNNIFEGIYYANPPATTNYLKFIWKNKVYYMPTGQTVFAGLVLSNGTAGNLPSGWTVAKTGTGQYRITHNLGNPDYIVTATSANSTFAIPEIESWNENYFDVYFIDHLNILTALNTDFNFHLVPFL